MSEIRPGAGDDITPGAGETDDPTPIDQNVMDDGQMSIGAVSTILDLLVRDLYGNDPFLTVRELVQNAHDALMVLPGDAPDRRHRPIVIMIDALGEEPYLEVTDHGIGMTLDDVKTKLCVVGNSSKLKAYNPVLIGKYGIGFLSSFIVADHVEVVTRHHGSDMTLRWETRDKENWKITTLQEHEFEHGTRVRLYFRDYYSVEYEERVRSLRFVDGVESIIRQHCYLIPVPIQVGNVNVGGGVRRANSHGVPWESDVEARAAFQAMFGQRNEPLAIHRFSHTHTEQDLAVSGVLYFRDRISSSLAASLHVKRMLVDREVNRLVPVYAPFVQAIIECPDLQFDLARRTVRPFDPTYRWVRGVVAKEFETAFIDFARERTDDFTELWPNIDNTVISRLLEILVVEAEDSEDHAAAKSFVLNASRYIPFYVITEFIGAQGKPAWFSIDELLKKSPPAPAGEKPTIHFSESANPIEKELLLNDHRFFIDVSRAEKRAHQAMIMQMQAFNEHYPDYRIRQVTASRFEKISDAEAPQWRHLVESLERGIRFMNNSHEVLVERFDPATTAIAITNSNVDPEVLENIKGNFESLEGVAGADIVFDRMRRVLEEMQQKGGVLTIHINAKSALMRRLAEAGQDEVADLGAKAVCWRAVLDYYGWNSDGHMFATEKKFTGDLISRLLNTRESLAELTDKNRQQGVALREAQTRLAELDARRHQEELDAFVGVLDVQGSTASIVGNAASGPGQAIRYLQLLLGDVKEFIEGFARVIGFTGDGLQFFIPGESTAERNVHASLTTGLANRLRSLPDRNDEVKSITRETRFGTPVLRVALAYGRTWVGPVVSSYDLMGLPAVQATRLCADEQLYRTAAAQLLITEDAYNVGTQQNLWRASEFTQFQRVQLNGLATDVNTFRPAP